MIIMATILFNIFGIFKFGWSFNEMSANFLFAGILAGLVGGLGFNGTFDALVDGMKNILFGAMIVGVKRNYRTVRKWENHRYHCSCIDDLIIRCTNVISDYSYVYFTIHS